MSLAATPLPPPTPPPRQPTHRLSRSPKRARASPSPTSPLQTASAHFRARSRPATRESRRQEESRHQGLGMRQVATSPGAELGENYWAHGGRRREMSVPLLSQTLSSFSLSHTSPPLSASHTSTTTPPAFPHASTPRRHPATTPLHPSSPITHPSTAPLPQLASFLGSPFSTKTSRGRYVYSVASPSKGFVRSSSRHPDLEWLDYEQGEAPSSCRKVEQVLEQEMSPFALRRRRGTNGSASSLDELSGSGASTTSLPSLGRCSGEQHIRPTIINAWDGAMGISEEEEGDPSTPSRQLFHRPALQHGDLHMSNKTALASPGASPLVSKRSASKTPGAAAPTSTISPLQAFLMSRTPSGNSTAPLPDGTAPSPAFSRSPFKAFLPRLLSSSTRALKVRVEVAAEEDEMTDTEDVGEDEIGRGSFGSPQPRRLSDDAAATSCGIGLGIIGASVEDRSSTLPLKKRSPLTPHFSSASNGSSSSSEPSTSPLKAFSSRPSPLPSSPIQRSTTKKQSIHSNFKTRLPVRSQNSISSALKPPAARPPFIRRGITEPRVSSFASRTPDAHLLSATYHTPPAVLFGDIKPSPAAFASTGLVKKSRSGPGHGAAAQDAAKHKMASPVRGSQLRNVVLPGSGSTGTGTEGTSNGSVSVYVRGGAKAGRGLRRKGSQMFGSGTNSNSLPSDQEVTSPATPTKHAGFTSGKPARGLAIVTPSPTQSKSSVLYPFTKRRHPQSVQTSPIAAKHLPNRVQSLYQHGPIARASNPMLAETARMSKGEQGRLEREYVILGKLGEGEFSQVWKVREREGKGQVWAVKAGKPYTGYKNRLRQLEEVSILRALSLPTPHPNIITYQTSWEHASRLYIVTELLPFGDLSAFLATLSDTGGLGEARTWKLLFELSEALAHVHAMGFLHLDVKPSNVLITAEGGVKLVDFGMAGVIEEKSGRVGAVSPALPERGDDGEFVWAAQVQDGGAAQVSSGGGETGEGLRTSSGPGGARASAIATVPSPILDREVEGDRTYLCPEALGEEKVGVEADVYSLGILLVEAAMNVVLPYNGDGWVKLRSDDFSDLSEHYLPRDGRRSAVSVEGEEEEVLPVLSDELVRTIKAMLASRPEARVTLGEVRNGQVLRRVAERVGSYLQGEQGGEGGEMVGRALVDVENEEGFLREILGE